MNLIRYYYTNERFIMSTSFLPGNGPVIYDKRKYMYIYVYKCMIFRFGCKLRNNYESLRDVGELIRHYGN